MPSKKHKRGAPDDNFRKNICSEDDMRSRIVPLLITLSDGCYAQFPVTILPPISCRLAGVRLVVIDSDFHRGDETILNFASVW